MAAEKAYLTNLEDETVAAFATEICRRLAEAARQRAQQEAAAAAQPTAATPGVPVAPPLGGVGQLLLPFELQVLEVALEAAGARLERQAAELEAEANPVLDALTAEVSQGNLESERRVKNKLVRLTTRVETVRCQGGCSRRAARRCRRPPPPFHASQRPSQPVLTFERPLRLFDWQLKEVLEKLLDDEDDMRDMNLSAVAAERLAVASRRATALEGRSGDATPHPLSAAERTGAWVGVAAGQAAAGVWDSEGLGSASRTPARAESVASSASSSEWEDAAVEVVEALLQSFFFSGEDGRARPARLPCWRLPLLPCPVRLPCARRRCRD